MLLGFGEDFFVSPTKSVLTAELNDLGSGLTAFLNLLLLLQELRHTVVVDLFCELPDDLLNPANIDNRTCVEQIQLLSVPNICLERQLRQRTRLSLVGDLPFDFNVAQDFCVQEQVPECRLKVVCRLIELFNGRVSDLQIPVLASCGGPEIPKWKQLLERILPDQPLVMSVEAKVAARLDVNSYTSGSTLDG